MFLSLVSDDPADTVGVSVKDVSLLPQTAADNQFQLRFQPGSGVRSVNGISVTSISSTAVSISTQSSGGVVTATCSYNSFQTPAPTISFTLFIPSRLSKTSARIPRSFTIRPRVSGRV